MLLFAASNRKTKSPVSGLPFAVTPRSVTSCILNAGVFGSAARCLAAAAARDAVAPATPGAEIHTPPANSPSLP